MGVNNEYWLYGEIARLARLAVPPLKSQYVHDLICNRRVMTRAMAERLAAASALMGKGLTFDDWRNRDPDHGAFRNRE